MNLISPLDAAIKKSELYSTLLASYDELGRGMDASKFKTGNAERVIPHKLIK